MSNFPSSRTVLTNPFVNVPLGKSFEILFLKMRPSYLLLTMTFKPKELCSQIKRSTSCPLKSSLHGTKSFLTFIEPNKRSVA